MKDRFIKDTLWVALSNGLVLISSIISGFIVPNILGVTEYGYYQTFALYLTYTALLHFGFVDGLLLKYAGMGYNDIDKKRFSTNTRFYFITQIVVFVFLMLLSIFCMSGRSRIMLLFIGFDTLCVNLTVYYQYVSQGTMRFKELSIRKVLQAVYKILIVVVLYILYKTKAVANVTAYYYIAGICIVDMLLALWYVFTYSEITFGKGYRLLSGKSEYIEFYKLGIIMTLAYQVAHLVFVLDRQFVVKLFDTDTYSLYSFAYNLVSMVTTVVSAVSLVLFPSMKQKRNEDNIKTFDDWISLISIVVFAALVGYYILKYVLIWIAPKYMRSLEYVRIIFPGLAISCAITMIIFNYYKVFNKIGLYLGTGIIALVIGTILNWLAYELFGTPNAISAASIVTLFLWFLISQIYFIKKYNTRPWRNLIFVGALSLTFWLSSSSKFNNIIGMCIYILFFIILTALIHGKILKRYFRKTYSLHFFGH